MTNLIYKQYKYSCFADCGSLQEPYNGTMSVTTTTFGSIITFTCDDGFYLNGSYEVECQANGTWNSLPPTCSIRGMTMCTLVYSYSDHFHLS